MTGAFGMRKPVWLPRHGTFWVWRIYSPHGRAILQVDRVQWNGEEWWVHCRKLAVEAPIGERRPDESGVYENELDHFWDSVSPVGGRFEDLREEASR